MSIEHANMKRTMDVRVKAQTRALMREAEEALFAVAAGDRDKAKMCIVPQMMRLHCDEIKSVREAVCTRIINTAMV